MSQILNLSADLSDSPALLTHVLLHVSLPSTSLRDIAAMGQIQSAATLDLGSSPKATVTVSDVLGHQWEAKGLMAQLQNGSVVFETTARRTGAHGQALSEWKSLRSNSVPLASMELLALKSMAEESYRVVQDRAFRDLFEELVLLRKDLNIGALQAQVDVRISMLSGDLVDVKYAVLTLAPDVWSITFEREGSKERFVIEGGSVLATLNSYEKAKAQRFTSEGTVRPILSSAVLSEIYRLQALIDEYDLDGAESELLPVTWVDEAGEKLTFPDSNIAVRGDRVIFKTIDHDNRRELSAEVDVPNSEHLGEDLSSVDA